MDQRFEEETGIHRRRIVHFHGESSDTVRSKKVKKRVKREAQVRGLDFEPLQSVPEGKLNLWSSSSE